MQGDRVEKEPLPSWGGGWQSRLVTARFVQLFLTPEHTSSSKQHLHHQNRSVYCADPWAFTNSVVSLVTKDCPVWHHIWEDPDPSLGLSRPQGLKWMQGASSLQPLLVPNCSEMLGPTSRLLPNQNEFEVAYTRFFQMVEFW